MNLRPAITALLAAAAFSAPAFAGISVLVNDRTAHKIWRLTDVNNDGVITPDEIFVWFDGTNAAGTPAIGNLAAFNSRRSDNVVIGGDQTNHVLYYFKDLDNNGDAMGPNESRVIMTAGNLSGASLAAPTGLGFFPNGDLMLCNSGNGNGPDAIYRLHDDNGNGSYDDAGEASPWVVSWPGFGVGNGPYTPFEVVTDANSVGYMHNSSANLNGVYVFADTNGNGRADDAGEFLPWFNSTNQSSITVAAGFSLELDLFRPGSLYINQLAAGGVDQIIRLTDSNGNGNANDPGEGVVVYSTAEAGFTAQDIISMPGGDLLISDVIGKRIIHLHDADNDGLFSAGERSTPEFFSAGTGPVLDVRQLALIPSPNACESADFNCDGDVGTDADIEAFFACIAGNCPDAPCTNTADFNHDGDVGTDSDIEAFFRVLAGQAC